jgi:5-dehydro-2-deoxygluconokinase
MTLDLMTVGRVSVDLYADAPGAGFVDEQRFVKSIGGTATNVAVAAARLGRRAAVLTRVGTDPFGDYVIAKLDSFGVDTRFVGRDETLRTPLAFAALTPPEDPALLFYRAPTAPDMGLRPGDVDDATIDGVGVLWVAGSAMAEEPARSTIAAILQRRARRAHTVLDLDYRAVLWPDEATASAVIGAAVGEATVAIGNRSECRVAVGTDQPDAAADALLGRGIEIAVVKLGGDGVLVATADVRTVVPPQPVEVVCGLGAGDAFGGAFVHGLLAEWPPVRIVEYANAAGAIVAGRLMCADAMPTDAEISGMLQDVSEAQ